MNILLHTYDKLALFGTRQNEMLTHLISPQMNEAETFTKGAIVKMIRLLTPSTSTYEKETIFRAVEQLTLFGDTPVVFIVNRGEDFSFEVQLEPGKSFAGYNLRAYDAQSGTALGPPISGSSDLYQDVPVVDIDLAQGHTYRVHIVLEGASPSVVLLTEAFVVIEDNIDYGEVPNPPILVEEI